VSPIFGVQKLENADSNLAGQLGL